MKYKMKICLLSLVIILTSVRANSQDYDLIVKSNGDSIACHIDSVTCTHIYFEMMSNNFWIHTFVDKMNVIEFQHNAINPKYIVFRSGTSIIEELRVPKESMFDLQRNSICLETSGFIISGIYQRMFPLDDHLGIILGAGFSGILDILQGSGIYGNPVIEPSVVLGGPKHSFESGLVIYLLYESWDAWYTLRIGYRFQGYKGLLLRPAIVLFGENVRIYSLSAGYSF